MLLAMGYSVDCEEFSGGYDTICWQGTLIGGLQALLSPEEIQ